MKVLSFVFLMLSSICTVSVGVKRPTGKDNHGHRLLVWDVIGLLSQFLDWSDLFPFSLVCRMFEDVAKVSLSMRTGGLLRNNRCHNQVVVCESDLDVHQKSQWYAAMDGQRTLIEFEGKHLLIRGVGLHAQSGYTGRVIVKRRVKVPVSRFHMTADRDWKERCRISTNNEWVWSKQGSVMNLQSGQIDVFRGHIYAFNPPFLIEYDEESDEEPNLHRWDPKTKVWSSVSQMEDYECYERFHPNINLGVRLYRVHLENKLPIAVVGCSHEDDLDYCYKLYDFETDNSERGGIHSDGDKVDCLGTNLVDSIPPRMLVYPCFTHWFQIIDPLTQKCHIRSLIPVRRVFDGREFDLGLEYDCRNNARYALIIVRNYRVPNPCQIFDLQTGEMIGPETNGDDWVSEEVFHVPKQTQFTVRSVHQPRENIACVMVDEGGNETPMMDEHFRILHKDDVLFDVRSNEILFVEWEKGEIHGCDPPTKKQRRV